MRMKFRPTNVSIFQCLLTDDTQEQTTGLIVLNAREKRRLVEERDSKFLGDAL